MTVKKLGPLSADDGGIVSVPSGLLLAVYRCLVFAPLELAAELTEPLGYSLNAYPAEDFWAVDSPRFETDASGLGMSYSETTWLCPVFLTDPLVFSCYVRPLVFSFC